jgi:hypothetical protein
LIVVELSEGLGITGWIQVSNQVILFDRFGRRKGRLTSNELEGLGLAFFSVRHVCGFRIEVV